MLLVVPSIDLLDRQVVRAVHGIESKAIVYSIDPITTVRDYFAVGATLIHLVDLDAAIRKDAEKNSSVIEQILCEFQGKIKVQIAGGIKSKEIASKFIDKGAHRIVIGSLVYSNPSSARSILDSFGPERVVLALDYDDQCKVRTSGWIEQQGESVFDSIKRNHDCGYTQFLLTAISQDGTLGGPDISTLKQCKNILSNKCGRIIASGGIASEQNLEELDQFQIDEAIVGTAFLKGNMSARLVLSRYNRAK